MSKNNDIFSVWITPDCLEKLNMYATEAVLQHNSEIGGFARIHEEDNDVFVTDIFIPVQKATGGTFDITAEMDNEFMRFMMKNGRREELPEWKSLVHSHPVGMGPSMSSTDVDAIQRRAEDGECFSLIISASRNADSKRLFMHYCCNMKGKTLIFRDMEVKIGWSKERMDYADEIAGNVIKKLAGKKATDADKHQIIDRVREAICTHLPATFSEDRKALRDKIKLEVKEKVSSPYDNRSKAVTNFNPSNKGKNTSSTSMTMSYQEQADLIKQWETVTRLYCIGYEAIDPDNPNPNDYVTSEEAEKAKKLHYRTIRQFNKELRKHCGFGMGDLVVLKEEVAMKRPDLIDLVMEPEPIADLSIKNGIIALEVDGLDFWPEELEVFTRYEDIGDLTTEAVVV